MTELCTRLRFCVACSVAAVGFASLTGAPDVTVQAAQGTVAAPSARQQLGQAITLFASDDDSSEAQRLFLSVIARNPVTSPDGSTARYYLGRLYHRNYYMLRQRNALDLAVDRYKEVHNRGLGSERQGAWYAEARFYKSLAYLELGKWKDVYEAVDHIDASLDPDLEIDYLVWTIKRRSINRRVPTAALRESYLTLLKAHKVVTSRPDGVEPSTAATIMSALQDLLERWPSTRANTSPESVIR